MRWIFLFVGFLTFDLLFRLHATTLPVEFKAYDFGESYSIQRGGVVIIPYAHGFVCPGGVKTAGGILVKPGQTFRQYNASRMVCEEYRLERVSADDHRAYFHEKKYRYRVITDAKGRPHDELGRMTETDDFYLSHWRGLELFDQVFPNIELEPGEQLWRVSKN
jgi:hypothetical protein